MEENKTNLPEVAVTQQQESLPSISVFGNLSSFKDAQRMAQCLASSSIVPTKYQGNGGLANCIVALEMAGRMKASPLMIMQNLNIIKGNPTFSSKFLISCLNTCGRFSALRYKFTGKPNTDSWGCIAYAVEKPTGEVLEGSEVTIGMAKAEGWYNKDGSKWKTMPQLMLQYRAAAFFQRVYAPEISMGMHTTEEEQEIEYMEVSSGQSEKAAAIFANALNIPNAGDNAKPETEEPKPETVNITVQAEKTAPAPSDGDGDDLPFDEQ